jgi:hypothetical protein
MINGKTHYFYGHLVCTNQLKKFGDENADTQEMVWPKLSGGEAPSSFLEYLE